MRYHTHNQFHLGDNLVHLNFLRRLARENPTHEFVHAAHECHLEQLHPVVADVRNIRLAIYSGEESGSRDVWKNAGAGTSGGGYWERHPHRNDFVKFHLDWFAHLSAEMALECPIRSAKDLLFDYPAILSSSVIGIDCDVLVVNSRPCSGQLPAYDSVDYLDPLIAELARSHRVLVTQPTKVGNVVCTRDRGFSVTDIGALSLRCQHLVMVATGPMWPTFNVWNRHTVETRLVLLGNAERLEMSGAAHASDIESARRVLVEKGVLS